MFAGGDIKKPPCRSVSSYCLLLLSFIGFLLSIELFQDQPVNGWLCTKIVKNGEILSVSLNFFANRARCGC